MGSMDRFADLQQLSKLFFLLHFLLFRSDTLDYFASPVGHRAEINNLEGCFWSSWTTPYAVGAGFTQD